MEFSDSLYSVMIHVIRDSYFRSDMKRKKEGKQEVNGVLQSINTEHEVFLLLLDGLILLFKSQYSFTQRTNKSYLF